MSRAITPLAVEPPLGRPHRVRLDGHWFRVCGVLDGWVVRTRWWAHDEERQYLRLDVRSQSDARIIEAYRVGSTWSLVRVLD